MNALPSPRRPAAKSWFVGGGEMGRLIRSKDWSRTPLGSIAVWPQSLRSAVSILLPSKAQIILFWGPDLIALYNDAYRPVFGAKHPRALGMPARECWSEIREVLEPLLLGVMKSGEAFWAKDHLFYLDRQGYLEETYFDVSYDPVRGETGAVAGVFCIVSETTGRVICERRLRTLSKLGAGMSNAATVDAICNAAAETLSAENPADLPYALFYSFDGENRLRLVCSYGVEPEERARRIDLQTDDAWTASLAPVRETGMAVEARAESLLTGDLPSSASERLLILSLTSGNAPAGFLLAGVSRFLSLEGGYRDFLGLVAGQVSTAIAAAGALEEERKRTEALAELDRAKTAFFSNVSHEFRTPLTLMLGPLEEVLENASISPEEQREQISVVHRNGLRLLKLVNTLLDFSRIEAGRVQASYEPTDLARLTAELASVFRSAVEKGGIRLIVDCPPLPQPIYVDREMWEKIVLNLLSNAFKFTFEGEIEAVLRWADDHVELKVRDTGIGIPEEALPQLFERFFRVKGARARTHEGSGIGLALVQELVRLHGGTLGVESIVGRGTTFTIAIPTGSTHLPTDRIGAARTLVSSRVGAAPYVEEALRWLPGGDRPSETIPTDAPLMEKERVDSRGAARATAGGRILLADDNADMREYVRRLLSPRWTVESVGDGATAYAAACDRVPDLVLTDVMMPGMNGFELLQALRADPRTREVPVIMLSARAGEESRVEGLEAGADDYLIKPFSARELMARVGAHLELARLRREVLCHERELRAEAETAREEAQEANRMKSQIFSGVSHDLRTPLNAIVGYSHLLLDGSYGPVAERQKGALAGIQRNARELIKLVGDVLDLYKVESGKMSLDLSSVRIVPLLEEILIEIKPLLEMKSLSIQSHLPENLPEIESDATKIKQIVTNLVSNAVKFTEKGGVTIRVEDLSKEGWVEITVSDTGMGIEPESLPKIFESFYQIEESRVFGGSGLGLTIVKELVNLLQGKIRVTSEVGKGSTFSVFLPYRFPSTVGS
ncbi:MAG: ATP-binding protein [Candidatus Manganitrophus sp.]|nr:MAG: ATP-binding protein [Candidatus Manganitrophus sp.]